MEPSPNNVPLVDTPAADTLFEGNTWGWDVIDSHAMVSQNHNEPSFKNGGIPQSLSYINILLHCPPLKWLIIVLLTSTFRAMKEAVIDPLLFGDLLRYLGMWILMSPCSGWKRGGVGFSPPLIKRKIYAPIHSVNSFLKYSLTPSLVNLVPITLTPHPMLIGFGKFASW